MNRAQHILEDVRRQTGNTLYRCLNSECSNIESSVDMRPKDMMAGLGTACSQCGSKTEAIGGGSSLPGYIFGQSSRRGR
jgi:DNA-directed RNA polymerase subunit RPC12/RpoP